MFTSNVPVGNSVNIVTGFPYWFQTAGINLYPKCNIRMIIHLQSPPSWLFHMRKGLHSHKLRELWQNVHLLLASSFHAGTDLIKGTTQINTTCLKTPPLNLQTKLKALLAVTHVYTHIQHIGNNSSHHRQMSANGHITDNIHIHIRPPQCMPSKMYLFIIDP